MPAEVDKILRFVDNGGNLLWLADPGPLHGLEQLAAKLGLMLPEGIVIDPAATQLNAPGNWSIGSDYPLHHPVTANFDLITAFPNSRPILWIEETDWQHQVLIEIPERGWISRAELGSNAPIADFDPERDIPGPAIIAVSLARETHDTEQRIAVIGSGAFLANSYAGNAGNIDLGVNLINWLAREDHLITIQPRPAKDSQLLLSKTALLVISSCFLFVIPLLLAGTAIFQWWRRRNNHA